MGSLLSVGEALSLNAGLFPDKVGARDLARSLTYRQWNERACRLANGLRGLGMLWNNSSWGPAFEEMPALKGRTDAFEMLPDLRYDRMAELMHCHGEFVTRPQEVRGALERAFRSGKTALVNVIGDRHVGHPSLGGNLLGSTRV
jgi:hypothetical protein